MRNGYKARESLEIIVVLENPLEFLLGSTNTEVIQNDVSLGIRVLACLDSSLFGLGDVLRVLRVSVWAATFVVVNVANDLLPLALYTIYVIKPLACMSAS